MISVHCSSPTGLLFTAEEPVHHSPPQRQLFTAETKSVETVTHSPSNGHYSHTYSATIEAITTHTGGPKSDHLTHTLDHLINDLTEPAIDEDTLTARQAYDVMTRLHTARNLIDHLAATFTGHLARLRVAERQGRKLRELLICMGYSPTVAQRYLRIATATDIPRVTASAALGSLSSEHADAIVRGLTHIAHRSPAPVTAAERLDHSIALLSYANAGMTPSDIQLHARELGSKVAAETDGGLPAADDRTINELTLHTTHDGRLAVKADLDVIVGEKLSTAIDALSTPVPQPDGSTDPRSTERRRADALETLLDAAARGLADDTIPTTPHVEIIMVTAADDPAGATLAHMGPIAESTADLLTCDSTITHITTNGDGVALNVGRRQRFFTNAQRKAYIIRDRGCIKCGAPASRCHAHHIRPWSDGGATDLDNGCLLCPSCHDDIHHGGWDVFIGADRHPWLIPPTTVDPKRRPQAAYNRRTMRLDAAA